MKDDATRKPPRTLLLIMLGGLALSTSDALAADPLGTAPTYANRPLGPVPNGQAITQRIWVPGLDDGYVPQGLTVTASALYVSSYRSVDVKQNRGPCRLFKLDMISGATVGEFDLPASCGHAGGIAKGPRGRLFVADTRAVYEIELARPGTQGLGRVTRVIKLAGNVRGSFAAGSADALWLGTFARGPEGKLYKIPFAALRAELRDTGATQVIPLPSESQGAAFDAAGRLWITRSTSKFGELVQLDPVSGTIAKRYAMPIGIEDLSFDGTGGLWSLSEAGSKRWLRWPTFFPVIFRLDLAKLR